MNRKTLNKLSAIALLALIILAGSLYFLKSEKEYVGLDLLSVSDGAMENKNLKSFFGNIDDYELAFAHAQISEKTKVIAGITSHHFLAKDLIARFYFGIADDIENIVLIGPDHYSALTLGGVNVVTTELAWDTPYGQLEPNKNWIRKILNGNSNIRINDNIFKMEHSIYTEAPFIKKAFPQAKIVPLIVKNTYDYDKFIKIGENLKKILRGKTLLVISSDFSHEATKDDAKRYDDQSIVALQDLKPDNLNKITCDCRACISVMLGFLGENKKFHLVENKNSADFGSPDQKVTSYVSGYFLSD